MTTKLDIEELQRVYELAPKSLIQDPNRVHPDEYLRNMGHAAGLYEHVITYLPALLDAAERAEKVEVERDELARIDMEKMDRIVRLEAERDQLKARVAELEAECEQLRRERNDWRLAAEGSEAENIRGGER